MSDIRIKRGESLSLTVTFQNLDGTSYALAGVGLLAHVRDVNFLLVATLVPQPATVPGQAGIFVQDTSAWPEGLLRIDVLVQPPGGPQTLSDTYGIYVDRPVTALLPEAAQADPVTDDLPPADDDTGGAG